MGWLDSITSTVSNAVASTPLATVVKTVAPVVQPIVQPAVIKAVELVAPAATTVKTIVAPAVTTVQQAAAPVITAARAEVQEHVAPVVNEIQEHVIQPVINTVSQAPVVKAVAPVAIAAAALLVTPNPSPEPAKTEPVIIEPAPTAPKTGHLAYDLLPDISRAKIQDTGLLPPTIPFPDYAGQFKASTGQATRSIPVYYIEVDQDGMVIVPEAVTANASSGQDHESGNIESFNTHVRTTFARSGDPSGYLYYLKSIGDEAVDFWVDYKSIKSTKIDAPWRDPSTGLFTYIPANYYGAGKPPVTYQGAGARTWQDAMAQLGVPVGDGTPAADTSFQEGGSTTDWYPGKNLIGAAGTAVRTVDDVIDFGLELLDSGADNVVQAIGTGEKVATAVTTAVATTGGVAIGAAGSGLFDELFKPAEQEAATPAPASKGGVMGLGAIGLGLAGLVIAGICVGGYALIKKNKAGRRYGWI